MPKVKAKFNSDLILNSKVIYPSDFLDMVRKHEGKVIEVDEEVFGGYELELEGSTWALDADEVIRI